MARLVRVGIMLCLAQGGRGARATPDCDVYAPMTADLLHVGPCTGESCAREVGGRVGG